MTQEIQMLKAVATLDISDLRRGVERAREVLKSLAKQADTSLQSFAQSFIQAGTQVQKQLEPVVETMRQVSAASKEFAQAMKHSATVTKQAANEQAAATESSAARSGAALGTLIVRVNAFARSTQGSMTVAATTTRTGAGAMVAYLGALDAAFVQVIHRMGEFRRTAIEATKRTGPTVIQPMRIGMAGAGMGGGGGGAPPGGGGGGSGRFPTPALPPGLSESVGVFATRAMQAANDLSDAVVRVGLVFGGMATAAVSALTAVGIGFNNLQESSMLAFTTLLGSGEKARLFLDDLARFAEKTPFRLSGLIQTSQQLLAMGFRAEEVLPLLRAVSDASSALGGSQETLQRIVRALGQIRSKGRATAEELSLQLAEAGIPAWQMLAEKIGTDVPRAMKLVEQGAIGADTTIAALLEGMNKRYAGLSDKQSKTLSGMLSNLGDIAERWAGWIVQPLHRAFKEIVASFLNGPQREILRIVRDLREAFASAAMALRNFVREHRTEIIRQTGDALKSLVETGRWMVKWAVEAAPRVREVAKAVWEFLSPIRAFLARHPELVAAFALFTGARMLGITTAIGSLAAAFGALARVLGALAGGALGVVLRMLGVSGASLGATGVAATAAAGAFGKLVAAVGSLRLGLVGLVAIPLIAFLANASHEAAKIAKEMERSAAVADRIRGKADRDADARMAATDEIADPAARVAKAREEVEKQRKRVDVSAAGERSMEDELRKAEKERDAQPWWDLRWKDADAGVNQASADLAKATEDRLAAERKLADAERELAAALKERDKPREATPEVAPVSIAAGAGDGGFGDDLARMRGLVPDAVLHFLSGSAGAMTRAGASGDASDEQVKKGLSLLESVRSGTATFFHELRIASQSIPPEKVAELRTQFDAMFGRMTQGTISVDTFTSELSKLTTETVNASDTLAKTAEQLAMEAKDRSLPRMDMAAELHGMRGTIPAGSQGLLENKFVGLQQAVDAGQIGHDQWQQGMSQVGTAADAASRFGAGLQQAQAGLTPGVQMAPEVIASLNTAFDQLLQRFMNGQVGAERFGNEVNKLTDATQKAAQAAEQEALAKQRQEMLAPFQGLLQKAQGANPMVRQALEDRLIQMQQQRLSQQIDGAVTGFLRVNGVVGQTAEAFSEAAGNVHHFSQGVQQQQQIAGPDQQREWWGGVVSFLNSSAGQVASIRQQLEFAWSRYKVVRDKDNRLASQILAQIDGLTNQLNSIMAPQRPMFTEQNGSQVSIDPGLQTTSAVTVEFPNVTRMTNDDISKMADKIQYELRRRGRPT